MKKKDADKLPGLVSNATMILHGVARRRKKLSKKDAEFCRRVEEARNIRIASIIEATGLTVPEKDAEMREFIYMVAILGWDKELIRLLKQARKL